MPIPNFVAGRWTDATASESLPLSNPATGESLGRVPLSSREDTAAAVAAAARAFPSWREVPAVERIQVLFRLKALLEQQLDELAETMTREHGKTREESAGELKRQASGAGGDQKFLPAVVGRFIVSQARAVTQEPARCEL